MKQGFQRSLDDLENDLFSSLKPVNPDPQFVNKLQQRLIKNPSTIVEDTSRQAAALIVLIAFLSGLAVIVVVRLIMKLIRRISQA